jgi:hypothetical protein
MGILKRHSFITRNISKLSFFDACVTSSFALLIAAQPIQAKEVASGIFDHGVGQVLGAYDSVAESLDQAVIQSLTSRLNRANTKYPGAICRAEGAAEVRELVVSSRAGSMPFVPTDEIALAAPDPKLMLDARVKRITAVRAIVVGGNELLGKVPELLDPTLASFCPRFASMTLDEKFTFFSFLLDFNVHELPIFSLIAGEVSTRHGLLPSQIEKDNSKQAAPKNKEELYEMTKKVDTAEINDRAKALVVLFSTKKAVTATELNELLRPRGSNLKVPAFVHEQAIKRQLAGLRPCHR